MLILKDYAPYFRQKDEWNKFLKDLNLKLNKSMFYLSFLILIFCLFV